mgnify:CR=1 FL=1
MKRQKNSALAKRRTTSTDLLILFCSIFIFGIVLCIILAVASKGSSFRGMLFHNGVYTDWFMDFFNSIRDSAASNVYSERNSIYPPLAVAFFRFLGRMLPYAEVALDPKDNYDMQKSQSCLMIYLFYTLIVVIATYRFVYKKAFDKKYESSYDKKTRRIAEIFSFLTIFSYPLMYCMERGNVVSLAVAFTAFFVFFRDSESKAVREISYICLALAAGLKLYPAIFGLLLLFDKKYKEAIRLVVYGILAVVIPFILISTIPAPVQTSRELILQQRQHLSEANKYGDLDRAEAAKKEEEAKKAAENADSAADSSASSNTATSSTLDSLKKIAASLFQFRNRKSSGINFSSVSIQNVVLVYGKMVNLCEYIQKLRDYHPVLAPIADFMHDFFVIDSANIAFYAMAIYEAFAVFALFFVKKLWQKTFILSYLFLNIPTFSSSYVLWFLLIPLVLFLFDMDEKYRSKLDIFMTVLFALLFTPIPTFMWYSEGSVSFFSYVALKIPWNSRINHVIATPVFQLIFTILFVQAVIECVRIIKNRKNLKKSAVDVTGAETAENAEISGGTEIEPEDVQTDNSVNPEETDALVSAGAECKGEV